jgi:signal transduction histidine kinase
MAHFLLYQILPLAALWIAFTALARLPAFGRWGVPAVFAAGAVLQFAFWIHSRPDLENPDSLGFFRLGHGLETDLRSILFRPKLYPLFLGLFHSPHSLEAAAFWQCLLKLGMAGFLARFARLSGWKPATTAFVLFLFLCNALWLREPLRIFDTTLFAFLFTAFLALAAENLARYSTLRFAALCVSGGLTALTRQAADPAMALAMSLVLAIVGYRAIVGTLEGDRKLRPDGLDGVTRLFRPMGLSLLAGLAIAGAGAVYNGVHYSVFQRSVALGINLYTHASYYQLGDPASPEWDFVELELPGARRQYQPWETGFRHDMPWSANALPHRLERKLGSADAEEILGTDNLLRARSLKWAWENPGTYLASFANESARLLMKCEDLYPASILFPGPAEGAAMGAAPDFLIRVERGIIHQPPLLLLLAGLAALVLCRRRPMALVCAVAVVSYLALVAAVQIGLTRYALPVYPALLMLAGEAVDCIPAPWRDRSVDA